MGFRAPVNVVGEHVDRPFAAGGAEDPHAALPILGTDLRLVAPSKQVAGILIARALHRGGERWDPRIGEALQLVEHAVPPAVPHTPRSSTGPGTG